MEYIKKNYHDILEDIKLSVGKNNRTLDDVTLVAVTKNVDIEKMEVAKKLGLNNFGENRVQELLRKYEYFGDSVTWHLIGHLQKNKVKYIIDKVELIHSVDSLELAKEINKRASAIGKVQNILIQVNIANDEAKFGISKVEIKQLIIDVEKMDNIKICGFMTIIPNIDKYEVRRNLFDKMLKTSIDNSEFLVHNVDMLILSMGMTNDFREALESGSNMIRIGTGLFGERQDIGGF